MQNSKQQHLRVLKTLELVCNAPYVPESYSVQDIHIVHNVLLQQEYSKPSNKRGRNSWSCATVKPPSPEIEVVLKTLSRSRENFSRLINWPTVHGMYQDWK